MHAQTSRYGENSDNIRKPIALSRRLKPKLYNTVKTKTLSVGEFKYVL